MLTAGQLDFKILYIEDERVQAYFFINKCRRVFGDRCGRARDRRHRRAREAEELEQYTVIVSTLSRMDGVSFFHTLFSPTSTRGTSCRRVCPSAPLRMNIILTGAGRGRYLRRPQQVRSARRAPHNKTRA